MNVIILSTCIINIAWNLTKWKHEPYRLVIKLLVSILLLLLCFGLQKVDQVRIHLVLVEGAAERKVARNGGKTRKTNALLLWLGAVFSPCISYRWVLVEVCVRSTGKISASIIWSEEKLIMWSSLTKVLQKSTWKVIQLTWVFLKVG